MSLQYFSAIALFCIVMAAGFGAGAAEKICNKAAMPEIDFLGCEGARLHDKGQKLLQQSKLQIAEGQRIVADCERLEDKEAARDCNLLSSDMIEDAAFKQAEAADVLDEAARMKARAADLRRKKAREKR